MTARAWLLILLLVAPASAEPYLQWQGDAARSGELTDAGPEVMDLAYVLALEGRPFFGAAPIIIDRDAYFLRLPACDEVQPNIDPVICPVHGSATIHRVDLDTATSRIIHPISGTTGGWASDGELLFVAGPQALIALERDGRVAWQAPWAGPSARDSYCPSIAVLGDRIIAGCNAVASGPERTMDGRADPGRGQLFIQVVRTDGTVISVSPADFQTPDDLAMPSDAVGHALHVAADEQHIVLVSRSARGQADSPLTTINEVGRPPDFFSIWGLDWLGVPQWRAVLHIPRDYTSDPVELAMAGAARMLPFTPTPHIHADSVHVRGPRGFYSYDLDTGSEQGGNLELGSPAEEHWEGRAAAVVGDLAIVAGDQETYGFDLKTRTIAWETQLPSEAYWSGASTMLTAGGRAFGTPHDGLVLMLDVTDGAQLEQTSMPGHVAGPSRAPFAIGAGLAVFQSPGLVHVYGVTDASIGLDLQVSDLAPAPGEEVVIDLSNARPGKFGSELSFDVDWGDGSSSDTADGVISHVYRSEGVYSLLVTARNEAGQERSQRFTVVVAQPTIELPLLQRAMLPENQENTLLATAAIMMLGLALLGALRYNRRHRRMRAELAAIDALVAADDPPGVLRVELEARRAHIRGLYAQGRLDGGHFAALERYIDKVQFDDRLQAVKTDLGFLPVRLVAKLEEMLSDGRFSDWEYEHFIECLGQEKALTVAQRRNVQRVVRGWLQADA